MQKEKEDDVIGNETSDLKLVHDDEGGDEEDNQEVEDAQDGEVNMIDVYDKDINNKDDVISSRLLRVNGVFGDVNSISKILDNKYLASFKVTDDCKVYAIKVIQKQRQLNSSLAEQKYLMTEIQIMREMGDCGNIVKMHKLIEIESYINILKEFYEGGNLSSVLDAQENSLTEDEVRLIAAQLLLTIDFMQRKKIIHRDLKTENVLLNSKSLGVYDVRLTDFGNATTNEIGMNENKVRMILCGTPGYIPPEALNYRGYTPKSDIFSAGILNYYLMTKKNIFQGKDNKQTLQLNKECNHVIDILDYDLAKYSQEVKDLIGDSEFVPENPVDAEEAGGNNIIFIINVFIINVNHINFTILGILDLLIVLFVTPLVIMHQLKV